MTLLKTLKDYELAAPEAEGPVAKVFAVARMAEQTLAAKVFEAELANHMGLLAQMLHSTLKDRKVAISEPLALVILSLTTKPAHVILWTYTLFRMQEYDMQTITLERWLKDYAFGVPTEVGYRQAWEAQVTWEGNLLSKESTWVRTTEVVDNAKTD